MEAASLEQQPDSWRNSCKGRTYQMTNGNIFLHWGLELTKKVIHETYFRTWSHSKQRWIPKVDVQPLICEWYWTFSKWWPFCLWNRGTYAQRHVLISYVSQLFWSQLYPLSLQYHSYQNTLPVLHLCTWHTTIQVQDIMTPQKVLTHVYLSANRLYTRRSLYL